MSSVEYIDIKIYEGAGRRKISVLIYTIRAGEMDFKVGEPWNTENYCRPQWLADKKNFRILDALEWLKQ